MTLAKAKLHLGRLGVGGGGSCWCGAGPNFDPQIVGSLIIMTPIIR